MSHYTKIWLHIIISTENRLPLILPDIENIIYKIVEECFANQNCKIDALNGASEHIHFKLLMNGELSINQLVNNVLVESEQLINNELFKASSFRWNKEFAAFSISESLHLKVSEYIENQKELHKQKTFQKELDEFYRLHGLL